jgi:hypothetical protein
VVRLLWSDGRVRLVETDKAVLAEVVASRDLFDVPQWRGLPLGGEDDDPYTMLGIALKKWLVEQRQAGVGTTK